MIVNIKTNNNYFDENKQTSFFYCITLFGYGTRQISEQNLLFIIRLWLIEHFFKILKLNNNKNWYNDGRKSYLEMLFLDSSKIYNWCMCEIDYKKRTIRCVVGIWHVMEKICWVSDAIYHFDREFSTKKN